MDFKKLNLATGWTVFLVAAWTYISTIEPTASFWDCGEFIATAYKLQVGHPPGAPLFMILGRIASAFVSVENVPVAINILSALCSAFTILFLFWSITHMARKLALRDGAEALTAGQLIAVMGSGIVAPWPTPGATASGSAPWKARSTACPPSSPRSPSGPS